SPLSLKLAKVPLCFDTILDLADGIMTIDELGSVTKLYGQPGPKNKVLGHIEMPSEVIKCEMDEQHQRAILLSKSGELFSASFTGGELKSHGIVPDAVGADGGDNSWGKIKYSNNVLVHWNSEGEIVSENLQSGETHLLVGKDGKSTIQALNADGSVVIANG